VFGRGVEFVDLRSIWLKASVQEPEFVVADLDGADGKVLAVGNGAAVSARARMGAVICR